MIVNESFIHQNVNSRLRATLCFVTCLAWACTPPATNCPPTSMPICPEMYIVRSTKTAWLNVVAISFKMKINNELWFWKE